MNDLLSIKLESSLKYAVVSDKITYKITVKNNNIYELKNIILKSLLDEQLKFIIGSVKIGYVKETNENIMSGIYVGTLAPNQSEVIIFEAEIIKKSSYCIDTKVLVQFEYYDNQSDLVCNEYCESCLNKIILNNPSLKIVKKSSKEYINLFDEIDYSIQIFNDGDLDLCNLNLVSVLPNSLQLIDGTFKVNSKTINNIDIKNGVIIGDLKKESIKEICYRAKVISNPSVSKIKNITTVNYLYQMDNCRKYKKESEPIEAVHKMSISNFKHLNLTDEICIQSNLPSIEEINDIKSEVVIKHYNVIESFNGRSKEGQVCNGNKVIIHGYITENIEYTSSNSQSINSLYKETPFSTYINLPNDFILQNRVNLQAVVENINFIKINKRKIFRNLDILILAKYRATSN